MVEFQGQSDIEHVPQPANTELCFAAIVAAVTRQEVDVCHEALVAERLSEPDGSILPPIKEIELTVNDTQLIIKPCITAFDDSAADAELAFSAIAERLETDTPIALLHKKIDDPNDERHHWTLLTGQFVNQGETLAVVQMDPLADKQTLLEKAGLDGILERSANFLGISAVALSIRRPDSSTA